MPKDLPSKIDFTLRFAEALHRYGAPAHRLEESMVALSDVLGLKAQFFVTPTAIFASFDQNGQSETRMLRVQSSELDLGKIAALDELVDQIAHGKVPVGEADTHLGRILVSPALYGRVLTTVCYAVTCACAARFFGGGSREVMAALLIGLLIGIGGAIAAASARFSVLVAPLAATLAAFLATVVAAIWSPASAYVITLGSLIVLVPGLTITVAMKELATRHLASGTARLAGAFIIFATMGFGVAFGTRLASQFVSAPQFIEPLMLPGWTELLALIVAPVALAIEMGADRRFIPWIITGCVLAFGSARIGSNHFGTELGVFIGATMLGLGSNVFARLTRRPSAIALIPGMIMLVPGGMGFRGLSALLQGDVLSGIETIFLVTMVAIALVTGLLVANTLIPPRRAL